MSEVGPLVVVVMGVAGSGKTTVARALAHELDAEPLDGDDFHSPANVAKMTRGEALDDSDREAWLAALRARIDEVLAARRRAVLACSALKQAYRDKLGIGTLPGVVLVYIRGSYDLIHERLRQRTGHFMKDAMLKSQFAALEEPTDAIVADAADSPEEIVRTVMGALARAGVGNDR